MGHKHSHITRRKFLGQASCAAIGMSTFYNSILNLDAATSLAGFAAEPNDYKALVCILLAGGNDSYNMLVPRGAAYSDYETTRSGLAIAENELHILNPNNPNGKEYGLHPSMPDVANLFNSGKVAFMANTGTLVEPIIDEQDYRNNLHKRPLGLYSHSDQIQQWQTSIPNNREAIGWAGRMADIINCKNSNPSLSMNISLAGRNVFQAGQNILEYSISPFGNGSEGIIPVGGNSGGFMTLLRDQAVENMMTKTYENVFQQTYGTLVGTALDNHDLFSSAIQGVQPFSTPFSPHYLSQGLQMVAKTIAARNTLGTKRQTFFLTFGGWDHHDELTNNQLYMLGVVNDAIKEFHDVLVEMNMLDQVTTFTISDFARTLTTNGNGSDHAWGGNTIIMGGAVQGKDVYGLYPDLYLDSNPLNVSSRGNLIPTTSTDEYFAELALWFGVSPNDLSQILPNIGRFYDTLSNVNPLGFMPAINGNTDYFNAC